MTLAPSQEKAAADQLLERLQDPNVANSLGTLLDHVDLLAVLVKSLDEFISRTEVIGDSLIDGVSELRSVVGSSDLMSGTGIDPKALLEAGTSLAAALPKLAPSVVAAVESGAFEQLSTITAGLAAGAAAYETAPVQVGGVFALLKLLKDPDINRAISYGATIAKALGHELAAPKTVTQTPHQ